MISALRICCIRLRFITRSDFDLGIARVLQVQHAIVSAFDERRMYTIDRRIPTHSLFLYLLLECDMSLWSSQSFFSFERAVLHHADSVALHCIP